MGNKREGSATQDGQDAWTGENGASGYPSLFVSESADQPVVVHEEQPDSTAGHVLPFPMVGLGGSAGALEAFIAFFQQLPPDTGMAFVVVLHLAADQESHLVDILSRQTQMQTVQIEEGMTPEQNCVYVIPPNVFAILQEGKFHFEPRGASGPFLPIDELFHSLAREQRNYAIGVVFSGMDGDGALGLRAIKGEGGFSLVQTPESARYPDMPRSSIATDHVDMVLAPDQIAKSLATLAARYKDPDWQRVEEGRPSPNEEKHFVKILRMLKSVSGVDFRLYKPTTIRRRIARRMLMHKIESLLAYVQYLQESSGELRELQEDILINVTRFFRDPDVFQALKDNIIPQIFENRNADRQVRVWVAGCSSGEEVYSLALLLLEHLTGQPIELNIQLFGTDASEQNIQKARLGIYPETIVNEVSPERLRRFFIKADTGYQIAKRVRDLCIFARQNLCTDPPFSRLDMVSCRNVLIYFGSQLQRQVITTFHYALREDGFLLLGSSETIREFTDLFARADRAHKVFLRIGEASGKELLEKVPYLASHNSDLSFLPIAPLGELRKEFDLNRMADRVILARYGPPGVVINAQMEILQSRGRTSPFIEMSQGTASFQLARMTRESIAPEVMSAVSRAIEEDLPVQVNNLQIHDGEQIRQVKLEVLPLHLASTGTRYYLVVFLPQWENTAAGPALPRQSTLPDQDVERSLAQVQHDLATTKLYLQSLLDERDSRNQELISANEEIQSANEELQSTNEELETTKEELQSSNEELQTVNDELQNRNAVLTEASNDLSNLLNSVNLPVLMLSNDLHIRHFTPQTQRLMSVRSSDIGRPFGDFRLNLQVENLENRLHEVLDTLTAQEMEVQDREGRWYVLRVRPYRTTDNKIDGLVLVLVDIDQHRRSELELRAARDFAASVISNVPLPLVVVTSDRKIYSLNDAFCTLSGMSRQALEGRLVIDVVAGLWKMDRALRSMLDASRKDEAESSFEFEDRQADESVKTLLVRGRPLQPDGERFVLITFEDMTAHKEVQSLLKRERERLATQVAETTRELDRSREELRALTDSLMTSQEDERRRLARELHDDVSQRLALLDMDCGAALQDLPSDTQSAREKLESVRSSIAAVSHDVRTLSHRLHPSIIEHLGLAAALESLLDEFAKRDGMLTSFFADGVPVAVPVEVATGLYRITQEALRNVTKHAGRAHVKVSLTGEAGGLELQIADSGAGFDPERQSSGLGLISMKERARLIGANLTIRSALREGTKVCVLVPPTRNGVQ